MNVCLVQCLFCQVEVSATGLSLVQRSPNDCGVCLKCDQVKINNLDTCCEQVEEAKTTNFTVLRIMLTRNPSVIF
jgi:hypothetical protein